MDAQMILDDNQTLNQSLFVGGYIRYCFVVSLLFSETLHLRTASASLALIRPCLSLLYQILSAQRLRYCGAIILGVSPVLSGWASQSS